jgi:CRP-like cAMP-binding protein
MSSHPHDCAHCLHLSQSHLNTLTTDELDGISKSRSCLVFKKGQIIYHEGMRVNGIYCLHGGIAKVTKLGPKGKDQILKFMQPGDLAGYRSMVSNEPMAGSLVAHTEVRACFIPKEIFLSTLRENPAFSLDLLKESCHELGEWGKIVTHMAQKSVKERLAELLLLLQATFGTTEDGVMDIQLTREELANMVGTATESLIRLLSELKKDGIIESSGKKIKILNISALNAQAELAH